MSIKTKLTILFIALTAIPLLFIALVTTSMFDRLQREEVLNKLDAIAGVEKISLESYFAKNSEQLSYFMNHLSDSEELKDYDDNLSSETQDVLNELLLSGHGLFYGHEEILILDKKGVVIASSNTKNIDEDWGKKDELEEGKKHINVALFTKNSDGVLINRLVGPIYIDNELFGVLVVSKNLDELTGLFESGVGLGETGEILIAKNSKKDNLDYLLLRKYQDYSFEKSILENPNYVMNVAFNKQDGVFTDTIDYRGVPVYSSTRYIENGDIGLVVKVDKDEILSTFYQLRESVVALIVIVLTTSLLLAYLTARNFSLPIKYLAAATEDISNNNFSLAINIGTDDEIGLLAKSFNEMSTKLSVSYEELDLKVKSKTKELSQNVDNLEKLNKFMIDRELKMVELKKRIAELEKK